MNPFSGMTLCNGQEFMRTKWVAIVPDGEITPLIVERPGMNSYNVCIFVISLTSGSGQSKTRINCLYPKLDQFEDKSSCLGLEMIKSTKSLSNLQLIVVDFDI